MGKTKIVSSKKGVRKAKNVQIQKPSLKAKKPKAICQPPIEIDKNEAAAVISYLKSKGLTECAQILQQRVGMTLSDADNKNMLKVTFISEKNVSVPVSLKSSDDSSSTSSSSDSSRSESSDSDSDNDSECNSNEKNNLPNKVNSSGSSSGSSSSDSSDTSDEEISDNKYDAKERKSVPKNDTSSSSSSDSSSSDSDDSDDSSSCTSYEDSTKEIIPVKGSKNNGKTTVNTVISSDNKCEGKNEKEFNAIKTSSIAPVDDSDVSDVEVSDTDVSSSSSSDSETSSSDGESSSEEDTSEDEEEVQARMAAKRKEAAKKAKSAAAAAANWKPTITPKKASIRIERGSDGAQVLSEGKPFTRVDNDYWGEKAEKDGGAMADNSYEGAFGNDGFGAKSSEKLLQVRGKRFQHEKTKRKRSFNGFARNGGAINLNSFSTKFKYSDDEC